MLHRRLIIEQDYSMRALLEPRWLRLSPSERA